MSEESLIELSAGETDWPEGLEVIEEAGVWTPPPEVTNHNGEPIPPGLSFFAAPPEEIGPIITAFSTRKAGQRPMAKVSRLLLTIAVGSGVGIGLSLFKVDGVWQVLAGLIAAGLCWLMTGFKKLATYVGEHGVARLTVKNRLDRVSRSEVLRFEDADALRTSQTRQYVNGIYNGTTYKFVWTDAADKHEFRLAGTYKGEKKPPKPKDPFHFAQSAETAWSVHRFDRAKAELEARGCIRFPIAGTDWVEVGPGYFEFHRKGTQERWSAEEIGDASIAGGVFKIKRVDAQEGWFSKKGVYQFPYQQMANARLFLLTFQHFLNYQF